MSPFTGDTVQILYDGAQDITHYVLFERARFTTQMAAIPGTFEITLKDEQRALSFTTGHQIQLILNGVPVFGGYIWQVNKTYAFPADNTAGSMKNRLWVLSGTDYNIIFDKRVLRNPAHYTEAVFSPGTTSYSHLKDAPITDGELIRGGPPRDGLNFGGIRRFFDMSSYDFEDPANIHDSYTWKHGYSWPTQGTYLRATLEQIAQHSGLDGTTMSTFWMDAERKFHYISENELVTDWGFSDRPNNSTMFGFREGQGGLNAGSIVNDSLVWGGSEWAHDGDVVFGRETDIASVLLYGGRWQKPEMMVGDSNYKSVAEVEDKAKAVVYGPPGTLLGANMGLSLPEETFTATWFNARVPEILRPGQVVPISLEVFGESARELPLRSLDIGWPELNADGTRGWTRFRGSFGLLMSDPSWMWKYLQKIRPGKTIKQVVKTAKNNTSNPPYGSLYQDRPAFQSLDGDTVVVDLDLPDGSKTQFHIPFMYIGSTMKVFINGLVQLRNIDYFESGTQYGDFTFAEAPDSGDVIIVWAIVAGTVQSGGGGGE